MRRAEAIAAARDTAMNPAVLDAFALVISGAEEPPAYPGVAGREPDVPAARSTPPRSTSAMKELRKVLPNAGSYVSESNFFEGLAASLLGRRTTRDCSR